MDKKTKVALLIGVPLLVGGYFIYKQLKSEDTPTPPSPTPTPTPTPPAPASCSNYKVTTSTSNLNVRSKPNISASIVNSLAKGTIVSAKPSSTSGWMELCDGSGYSSSSYLTKTSSFLGLNGIK